MAFENDVLESFVYAEDYDAAHGRSLGYRLLSPIQPNVWTTEVEALARQLQASPYPDHWPAAELFCSVLLNNGRRLIALARYGLADHTASHRRGGLELIGVIARADVGVEAALAAYRWLRQRRTEVADPRELGGAQQLSAIVNDGSVQPVPMDPVPVLPIRVWQGGALLFAASVPSDPDHHLGLLEQGGTSAWQWLPLVGTDFPLAQFAQRGPLIAWTPHLTSVAVKLDKPEPAAGVTTVRGTWLGGAIALFVLLAGANLWLLNSLSRQMQAMSSATAARHFPDATPQQTQQASADRLFTALHRLLHQQGRVTEVDGPQVTAQYERLVANDPELRTSNKEAQELVVAVRTLSRRSAARSESTIRQALQGKGYDPQLIDLVCRRVQEQFTSDGSN